MQFDFGDFNTDTIDIDIGDNINDEINSVNITGITQGAPTGARVVLNALNLVQFVTGFAVGSNLTGNDVTLNMCQDTLSLNIVTNSMIFTENALSLSITKWFLAAYSMWDIFYFSNQLVNSCALLGYAVELNFSESKVGMFKISRLLNNVSNNYDNAYQSYDNVKSFMATPQLDEQTYATSSYDAGYSSGRMFYYMLFTTEYENLGGEPQDPFETLANQQPI